MSDIYDRPGARARAIELQRLPKARLVAAYHQALRRAGSQLVYSAHPPRAWSKQELAWDIVRAEFAEADATALLGTLRPGSEVLIGAFPGHVFRVVEVSIPGRVLRVSGPVNTPEWINIAAVTGGAA
jgi:hypothetical protein